MAPQNPEQNLNREQPSPEVKAEISQPEEGKAALPEKGRFDLPDLETAKAKKYPWAKTAESAKKFLSDEITGVEDTLEQLTEGVKEGTMLHKQIQKEAHLHSKEREKKGEAGTQENDFFSAIDDLKALNKTKLETFNQRWQRLEVLSSEKKGNQDEELNKRTLEKSEIITKKGKTPDVVECNDKTRQELLKEIRKGVTDKEAKKEIEKREKERVTNLKTELGRIHSEIKGILEVPGEGEERKTKEKIAKELYEKTKDIVKSLTGEDLGERVRNEAKDEAVREGGKIVTKKEYYSQENITKTEQLMQQKRWGLGVKESWLILPDEEKQKYGNDAKKFAEQIEKQREQLSQKLEKRGINLSCDVFYEFLRAGYNPQDIKIKGWFGKKIVLPIGEGGFSVEMKTKEFKSWTERVQNKITNLIKEERKNEMDRRFIAGRSRLIRRKNRIMGEIVDKIIAPPIETRVEKRKTA